MPKNAPVEVIDKLNRALNAAAAGSATGAVLGSGRRPGRRRVRDFGRIIADDVAKWAKVIKAAGLTGD